jgi:L-ascorbate metabolism protein UlaG (beta-lactamase superfamily)
MYSVLVTWYGQAGFRFAAGDSRVLIDPFLTDRDDRCYPRPVAVTLALARSAVGNRQTAAGWCHWPTKRRSCCRPVRPHLA